ncbi:hypothetical protein D3C78_1704900 [compost metagenome]
MVGVAAAMVADRAAYRFRQLVQTRDQGFNGFFRADPGAVQRCIQAGDVGLMMLAVVDLHRHRVDVRFQGVVGVRQGRKGVGHACLRWTRLPDGRRKSISKT